MYIWVISKGGLFQHLHLFNSYVKTYGGVLFNDKKQIHSMFDFDGDVIMK